MTQFTRSSSFNISFFNTKLARKNMSKDVLYVVGYARLSFDEDGSGYCSILNQRDILETLYQKEFAENPEKLSTFTFIEDDNVSGYKFERPGFFELVQLIESGQCNVIIAKDLSRIGRHGALTQLFIEQCERVGIQIIAMDDYNSNRRNDNYILGIHTWNNERAVKDASEKVSKIIDHQQKSGIWLCAVPYGYIADFKRKTVNLDPEAAKIVRFIGEQFVYEGYGINKIAKILNEKGVPTPRMYEAARRIAEGYEPKGNRKAYPRWNGPHIGAMLDNDFYNGTYRTGKYTRDGINGADMRTSPEQQHVFKNHHEAIWDDELWALIQEKRKQRKQENYRGFKKTESLFHGIVFCGECDHRMYMYRKPKLKPTYVCSQYFRHGVSVCCRNPIKEEVLVEMTVSLLMYIKQQGPQIINAVDAYLPTMQKRTKLTEDSVDGYSKEIAHLEEELLAIEEQRVKQIIAHPEREAMLNTIYDKMHADAQAKIDKLQKLISALENQEEKAKEIIKNIKTAMDAIDNIIETGVITRFDAESLFKKITVYKNGRINVELVPDLSEIGIPQMDIHDQMPHCSDENARAFEVEGEDSSINVVSNGDPLETTFIHLVALASCLHRISQQFVKNRVVQN